jgi:hypothetical protein
VGIVREVTVGVNCRTFPVGPQTPSLPDPRRFYALSPSQKIQSQAQRKHVVASGLLHRLHDSAGATGRDDAMERPDELPGSTVDPDRINDISSPRFSKLEANYLSLERSVKQGIRVDLSCFSVRGADAAWLLALDFEAKQRRASVGEGCGRPGCRDERDA